MVLEREKVDFELVCSIVNDMVSGDYTHQYWEGFLNGMSLAGDDKIDNMWYLDCFYSKVYGKISTIVTAGTPTEVMDEIFHDIIQYGEKYGYFDINTILDHMNNIRK